MTNERPPTISGTVQPGVVYTRDKLMELLGLGEVAMRKAKRKGLKARLWGRRRLYLGSEVVAWVEKLPVEQ